jgi:hypothetical protein
MLRSFDRNLVAFDFGPAEHVGQPDGASNQLLDRPVEQKQGARWRAIRRHAQTMPEPTGSRAARMDAGAANHG